nr:immunoglobulin light chain junction region [Macaca mulatta]MOW40768.1 immunoglobulin light chain junction region [Macaca mulatta]MOW40858.1 immunoglobulin light chain junction region [Macaca mulatta]MOW41050.1 immunoglobulin light chain junction region [Macaca mulatta]MOW41117.1 immunoglobulin light chain junction region [Macaca mulatta]
CQQHDSSPRTF